MVASRHRISRLFLGLLALSLLANGWLVASLRQRSADERSETGQAKAIPDFTSPTEEGQEKLATRPRRPGAGTGAGGLRWKDLASPDFTEFAENLRAAGCAEEMIADLLVPEINHTFRRNATARYLEMVKEHLPWSPSPEWKEWLSETEFSAIDEEHDLLIANLFGEEFAGRRGFQKWPHWKNELEVRENKLGFLDSELRKRIEEQEVERYQLKRELRRRTPRPSDNEIEDAVRARRAEHLAQLRGTSANEAIDEYALRSSPYAEVPRVVPGLELSADEMREITSQFERSRTAGDTEFAGAFREVRTLLGDSRFATFEPAARNELAEILKRRSH